MWRVGTETCAYGLCSMMTQCAVSTQQGDGSPRRCCTDEQICNESTAKSSDHGSMICRLLAMQAFLKLQANQRPNHQNQGALRPRLYGS